MDDILLVLQEYFGISVVENDNYIYYNENIVICSIENEGWFELLCPIAPLSENIIKLQSLLLLNSTSEVVFAAVDDILIAKIRFEFEILDEDVVNKFELFIDKIQQAQLLFQ